MTAPVSKPVRRILTGHDAAGKAVVRSDDLLPVTPIPSGDANFSLIWTTATVPADNNDETDGRLREAGLTLHQGSVIRIVDMLPGGASPMHRSSSIDYGIVLSGSVELELDDGAVTTVHAGDIIVQRGTLHLWRNPSQTDICRIAFVLIEAAPVQVGGAPLPDVEP
ncbi:MAG: cupin [Novosphingobium sp. 28-62-57]|uniref:cupin domain-containing protein n=1 Tax=unclassified Novosphingobium TaxID=2644732 RepID=UPI000BC5E2F6|nr:MULTISPECIES: cupin domain-containing protein [unclassified Novosphingobium]OYW49253.1 MAG: cupin [Novosphingobium sp. 12-62-10]OYZ09720.1 MAG: cupin [Novosphingobium sp. 28-62-57]OZA36822.1 MAG: cupin [Novosphingobium sp. 17-62-9]HQS68396.1 cupin domain-containing protein [Novosphingobium sp.]